jgi:NAD+ synthase
MQNLVHQITTWITDYAVNHNLDALCVGVSGGIDSAVVSILCAETGLDTYVLSMPIRQKQEQHDLSVDHCLSLLEKYKTVHWETHDLTAAFESFENMFPNASGLSMANTRSRLRMITLYAVAQNVNGIVVGTGNKVEDFGVGFFTKYGDGGVDISPIADLTKTEVWELGRKLGVDQRIIDAAPTDGLWDDGRIDQDQLRGLSYTELELAMQLDNLRNSTQSAEPVKQFEAHEERLLETYHQIRKPNLHKMMPIPVFKK